MTPGTWRARTAEQTWNWLQPVLPKVGITRVAQLTGLDEIGVPVWQAIRPAARSVSVSQGKGVTDVIARVSAAMESIELWHAEQLAGADVVDTVGAMTPQLCYDPAELLVAGRHALNPALRLEWSIGRRLDDGGPAPVPTAALRMDGRVTQQWRPPVFRSTTNGLAAGNTEAEAVLHGLLELLERDALAAVERRATRVTPVDVATVDGPAASIVELFHRAAISLTIDLVPTLAGVACLTARIRSEDFPVSFEGHACHPDRSAALTGALVEAAQSRLTAISGAREDVVDAAYRVPPAADRRSRGAGGGVPFDEVPDERFPTPGEAVRSLVPRVVAATGRTPIVVEHTRPDIGVPVHRVIGPRLRYPAGI